jgi:hypothetical protein
VRDLAGEGLDYPEIGRRLGIAAGQAYLIGTGMPADGGDTYTVTERQRPHVLPSAQHLIGPPVENPMTRKRVLHWIKVRVHADEAMRRAAQLPGGAPGGKGQRP